MKNLALLLLILSLAGCGTYLTDTGSPGAKGDSSSISLIRFTSDDSVCPSGSGVMIQVSKEDGTLGGTSLESAAVVCDGMNGAQGEAGLQGPAASPTPYDVVQIVDPCGDAPGIYDEVFFKTSNGTLIASFSDSANGNNTRLSVLVPGSYVTTDGSNCHFTVANDGSVSW